MSMLERSSATMIGSIRRWGIVLVPSLLLGASNVARPTIFLVGDSTMAEKPLTGNPERGWGQMLGEFFTDQMHIQNHARNGRSTKSFIDEGHWKRVVARLEKGDFVLIQFGHNDAKREDPKRYADAHTTFKANLITYVHDSRAKGATPVLITPVCRRRFDSTGKFYDVHGEYPEVVRELGRSLDVPVLDLHARSAELFRSLGPGKTRQLFLRADSGKFSAVPAGKEDNTHFVSRGAWEVARMVVHEMKRVELLLTPFLKAEDPEEPVGAGKLVVLDNYFNNEWKKDESGRTVRFHYLWDDTALSGFSSLANVITSIGADIDTFCQPPTPALLRRADLYIIVDPDTKLETESPNYIDNGATEAIVQWVNSGGVLVLLGNDKGKAEFEHFNRLAARFGIRFNEDSRNPATSTEFQHATFDRFPDHQLFRGIRRIFLKEIGTLSVSEPARAIFTDGIDVIMAFALVGEGAVFAVGDPWFYNEYMGTWRLPEGYDNPKAAENLFRWLLRVNLSSW